MAHIKDVTSHNALPKFIKEFIEAVYPEASTLAMYAFNEEECLVTATQLIRDLKKEAYELKQQIEKYQCNTGWARVIELEKEIDRINGQRIIEQGAWEETKKYQDMYIKEKKSKLSLNEMLDIMREMLAEEDDWNCDMFVDRIYEAQIKKGEK